MCVNEENLIKVFSLDITGSYIPRNFPRVRTKPVMSLTISMFRVHVFIESNNNLRQRRKRTDNYTGEERILRRNFVPVVSSIVYISLVSRRALFRHAVKKSGERKKERERDREGERGRVRMEKKKGGRRVRLHRILQDYVP